MNMQSIMAQAQRMQRDLQKKKDEINKQLFPGKYEFVEVTLNGKKEMVKIIINEKDSIEKDDLDMLEDMILVAFNEASKKVDADKEKRLSKYQGLSGLM